MTRVLAIGSLYPPHHFGGYELVWEYTMRNFSERGIDVQVLASDYRQADVVDSDPAWVHRQLRWYWRDHEFPPIGRIERLRLERHNRAVLRRNLADFDPDVVMWWSMGGMSLSLIEQVRRAGLPAVGYVGDDWLDYGPAVDAWTRAWRRCPAAGGFVETVTRLPTRLRPGAAGVWHFNSRRTLEHAENCGWALPRAVVTPSGVPLSIFKQAASSDWGWRLLYVGRIDPRKGIATAIDALTRLPADATLGLYGHGDENHAAALRTRAAEKGLSDRLRWSSASPGELAAVYAAADAVVFPVEWDEPWGMVPLEAMAVGRPVVATGAGGSAEYLVDGENCLLFEPGDGDALAEALIRLAASVELRETLRAGGLRTARRYSSDHTAEVLERSVRGAAAT